jgi:peptidoglycan/xylan/chitin deacetylase (PgdA/CDA1 family)
VRARPLSAFIGCLLASAVVALLASGCGSGAGALGAGAQIHPLELVGPLLGGTSPQASGGEFRIVGCRSSGTAVHAHGPHRYEVAIGFDDGPYPDTPAFVRMLSSSHAAATFFMIGRQVDASYRETMIRELREGDVLGDHTFTHPDLTQSHEVRSQLQRTISAIRAQTGYTPCVFRPPYGDVDASVARTARSLGLATVTWDVDPADYTQPGVGAIEHRVLAQVLPGSIIISHDGGGPRGQTLAAYPKIIAALRRRGYGIVTIPQLLGFRPVYERCVRLCDGLGVPRSRVPREAIIQRAP